ncbi:hypothetical protein ACHQM5_011068 [Ranunculus cassubicifolius]
MAAPTPSALPPTPSLPSPSLPKKSQIPTPQELIHHYESQGLQTNEATMKVIEDLQNVLVRVISSSRGKKDRFMGESSRKLEHMNTRLAILELKMDSKPGFGQSLAIGVGAGAIVNGFGSVVPYVLGAIGEMWTSVKSSTGA